jgi:hypothetical protein
MALITVFWIEFWRVLFLPSPPQPVRHSAEIIDLAQWRSDHPPERAA